MKQNKTAQLTLEELKKNKAKSKALFILLGFSWVIFAGMVAYLYFFKSKPILHFIPILIALPITYLPVYINIVQIDKEIKSRN